MFLGFNFQMSHYVVGWSEGGQKSGICPGNVINLGPEITLLKV